MKRSAFKKFQVTLKISSIYPLMNWMRESGISFLAKLRGQHQWTKSEKATAFFKRFDTPLADKARTRHDGRYEPIKLHLKILNKRDWKLVRSYILLSNSDSKIGRITNK